MACLNRFTKDTSLDVLAWGCVYNHERLDKLPAVNDLHLEPPYAAKKRVRGVWRESRDGALYPPYEPAPCFGCELAASCAKRELDCEAYRAYVKGYVQRPWPARRESYSSWENRIHVLRGRCLQSMGKKS